MGLTQQLLFYLRISRHIRKFKVYRALRRTFSILFPFVVVGSTFQALNQSVFQENGFFASIYNIPKWLPHYVPIGKILTALSSVTINIVALIAAFLMAKYLAHYLKDDDHIVGICGLLVFLLFNFNFVALAKTDANATTRAAMDLSAGMGFRNFLLSLLIAGIVAYSYHGLAKLNQKLLRPDVDRQNPMSRGIRAIFPVTTLLVIASVGSYFISLTTARSLANLINGWLNISVNSFSHITVFIFTLALINNIFTFLGLTGPLGTLQSINNTLGTTNLDHALTTKNLMTVPHPLTLHTLYETYGSFGGSGMTLALLLSILIFAQQQNIRRVAKFSLLPALVNLNEPLMIGLPIIFNPIMLIPYLLSPLFSMSVAWLFIKAQWMPPAVYAVPRTTPAFLLGFLGTNGNVVALLVSFLCLLGSMLIYLPFIRVLEMIYEGEIKMHTFTKQRTVSGVAYED